MQRYVCPICKKNQTSFEIIYRLSQLIQKDPVTGETTYTADNLEMPMRHGKPDIEIRCTSCGYVGYEGLFVKAAAREERAF